MPTAVTVATITLGRDHLALRPSKAGAAAATPRISANNVNSDRTCVDRPATIGSSNQISHGRRHSSHAAQIAHIATSATTPGPSLAGKDQAVRTNAQKAAATAATVLAAAPRSVVKHTNASSRQQHPNRAAIVAPSASVLAPSNVMAP